MTCRAFWTALGGAGLLILTAVTAPAEELDLQEPASFRGLLPCADCPGIDWHLDLWPDGRFHLRRDYRTDGSRAADVSSAGGDANAVGRWIRNAADGSLVLQDDRESPLRLEIIDRDTLRLLDRRGDPIESQLPYELRRSQRFVPAELSLPLRGEFRYFADAAAFQECLTGYRYPVLMEGDYLAAESAYTGTVDRAGDPLFLQLDGAILNRRVMEGEGPPQSLRIERLAGIVPDLRCERAMAVASLTNTYWRVLRLGGDTLERVATPREVHLILRSTDGRATGFAGCNRFSGGYEIDGDTLAFPPLASTMMACPDTRMLLERRVHQALAATRQWRIDGQTLELFDAEGASTAFFEAVYLP